MKIFLFECKKMLKKRGNQIAIFLSVLAIATFYLINHTVAQNILENRLISLEYSLTDYPEMIRKLMAELEDAKKANNEEKINNLESDIEFYEYMLKEDQWELEQLSANNWGPIAQKQYERLNEMVKVALSGNLVDYYIEDQTVSIFTLRVSAEERRLLAEAGIEPFIQRNFYDPFHPTIYDHFTGKALERWEEATERYGKPGFHFLYQISQSLVIPFFIIIGCLIFANGVSSEATKKNRGFNFYTVLPLKRQTLFWAKYGSGLFFTILFVLFIMSVPLILSGFTSGPGSLQFPVLIYDGPAEQFSGGTQPVLNALRDEFHFITLGEYFLNLIPLTLVLIVFLYSLFFLLNLWIKNATINAALVITTLYLGMAVLPVAPYNPFTYIDMHKIINREFAVTQFNEAIHSGNGMIVLSVVSLILIGVGYWRFKRYVVD